MLISECTAAGRLPVVRPVECDLCELISRIGDVEAMRAHKEHITHDSPEGFCIFERKGIWCVKRRLLAEGRLNAP